LKISGILAAADNSGAAQKHEILAAAIFLLILGCVFLIYFPGLNGGFLLDDYPNLRGLTEIGEPASWKQIAEYVLGGFSGALGRPVALLSFALQHADWPGDARAFKYVNLSLHVMNGCLLCWFLLRLGKIVGWPRSRTLAIALTTTGAWLLHPMQVSTVLYVVQRMTELSTLFTLAGLLAYFHGRERLLRGEDGLGYLWLSAGVVLGGAFATLSKESGILLVIYIWVLEATLLSSLSKPKHWRPWAAVFLFMPLLSLAAYLLLNHEKILAGYTLRDFTLGERLLTEPRVLVDYIAKIFLPHPRAFGLLFDDYPVSRSLLKPLSTLPALLVVVGLIGAAIKYRKRQPAFSFGVLWFFAGHLLESTFIPLELYYEHRNYLSMLGPVFAATFYATGLHGNLRRLVPFLGVIMLGLIVTITWNESLLWANPYRQAITWAAERPLSSRAQEYLAGVWIVEKKDDEALKVFKRMIELHPRDASGYMHWMRLTCTDRDLPMPNMRTVVDTLKISAYSTVPVGRMEEIVMLREKNQCQRLNYQELQQCMDALLANPRYYLARKNLYALQARLYATAGLLNPAMETMDKAYAIEPTADFALLQMKWLASAGLYDDALRYVQKAREANERNPLTRWLYRSGIDEWEQQVRKLQKAARSATTARVKH